MVHVCVCKKKNLKSIDYMRQKVWAKNLKYRFYRSIKREILNYFLMVDGIFNNIMSSLDISKKLKTFAHSEYSGEEFSSPDIIDKKILGKEDLFNRGYKYEKVELDQSFPKYLLDNKKGIILILFYK